MEDPTATTAAARRDELESVVARRAFGLVYQPIVHLDTGVVAGVEALCRFDDGESPERRFPECEALGLAAALDLALIEAALADLARLDDGYLSVNLSPSTLLDARLADLLLAPGVPCARIVVEVTEHARIADYAKAGRLLTVLRQGGIRVAVDDAGAGYATFRHVLSLRPDIIKMDRSLTQNIDADMARRALATALVIFAGEIGATVVAEGVETQGEILTLRRVGIHRAQGFALARPEPLPLAPIAYQPLPIEDLLDLPGPEPETMPWAGLEATMAVTAHGLLASLAAVEAALALLERQRDAISEEQYRALVGTAKRQARHVGDGFRDMVRGLPPELLSFLDAADPTHPSAEEVTLPGRAPETATPSPMPPSQTSEQMTDLVLDALDDVVIALRESDRGIETALARAASVRHQRLRGESYSAIVDGHAEPLLVTLLAEGQRRLAEAGARLRRAEARALYSEGKTMEAIAELFGVTRQRISVLISSPADKPAQR